MGKVPQRIDIRLQYKIDSREGILLRYLQTHQKSIKEILLESAQILWEPYAVFDSFHENMPFESLKKLVDSSYQRCLSHYQNMSVDLGLITPGTHVKTVTIFEDSHNLSSGLVIPNTHKNITTNNTKKSHISSDSYCSQNKETNNSSDSEEPEYVDYTDLSEEDIDDIKL